MRGILCFIHLVTVELMEARDVLKQRDSNYDKVLLLLSLYVKYFSESTVGRIREKEQAYPTVFNNSSSSSSSSNVASDQRPAIIANSLRREHYYY